MPVRMKAVLSLDSIICRRADLVATDIDQDKVFLDVSSGKYCGMNRVGSSIWDLAEQPIEIRVICARLLQRFEIDESVCQRETVQFCQELFDTGSLTLAPCE